MREAGDYDDFDPATKALFRRLEKIGNQLERIADSLEGVDDEISNVVAAIENLKPDE